MNSQLDIAREYVAAGISVIPVRLDGTKAPAVDSWAPFQSRLATPDELTTWFEQPAGIGIACGIVSGGLEVLDFDHDADVVFSAWVDQLPSDIRGSLTVIETPKFGRHVPYRCNAPCGNKKIAMSPTGDTVVESRGQGGYVVGVGSPIEVHTQPLPYVQTHGQPLPELPVMTDEQRKTMWTIARSFDDPERAQRERGDYAKKLASQYIAPVTATLDTSTPWDDFKVNADWFDDVIGSIGWHSTDSVTWTRPGKTFGCSAKLTIGADGLELLTVYSSNAGPLSPTTGNHKTWNKFSAYAAIHHGGSYSDAARAVREKGYGQQ